MQPKFKICHHCNHEKIIWKQHEGHRYCRDCWGKIKPVKGGKEKKVFTPIPKRSEKRKREEIAYKALRKSYLSIHPECEAKISKECNGNANQIHHKVGRIGERLCDDKYFLAVCDACHRHIENNREQAIELGFSELRTNK